MPLSDEKGMSAKATFWAWEQDLTSTQKLVLLCLADCHNGDNDRCDPSIKYICSQTGLDKKTVPVAMSQLESIGLISIKKRAGISPFYTLNLAQKRVNPNSGVPQNGVNPKTGNVTDDDLTQKRVNPNSGLPQKRVNPKTDLTLPKNGYGVYPKTGNEPKKNLKESKTNNAYAFCGETIRLNFNDYEKIKSQYQNLDIDQELSQLDLELRDEKKWFMSMHSKLNYRNKQVTRHASSQLGKTRKQTPAERIAEQIREAQAARASPANHGEVLVEDDSVVSTQVGIDGG